MIPKICANCAHGANIRNGEGLVAVLCSYLPIHVAKVPDASCGCFAISDEPEVLSHDPQVGALEEMMGNPMEQFDELTNREG